MNPNFMTVASKLGLEVVQAIREAGNQLIDDAVFEEKVWGFSRAVDAMLECNISDEKIIAMLQKYWDLRLSEATQILTAAKEDKITVK